MSDTATINGASPAMPLSDDEMSVMLCQDGISPNGLTKREYFAGLAFQALTSNSAASGTSVEFAQAAVICADALLKELAK